MCNFREIREQLKVQVDDAQTKVPGSKPGLAIVQVGGRADSNVYIRMKAKAAADIGIDSNHLQLPRTITEHELLSKVEFVTMTKKISLILRSREC